MDPGPGGTAAFYGRRFAYEAAMHRADAALALGASCTLDQAAAADAIDEWMELRTLRMNVAMQPRTRELLGPGRTLHFHATDTPPDLAAEWVVEVRPEYGRNGPRNPEQVSDLG